MIMRLLPGGWWSPRASINITCVELQPACRLYGLGGRRCSTQVVPRRGERAEHLKMAGSLISKGQPKVISNRHAENRKKPWNPPFPDFQGHLRGHERGLDCWTLGAARWRVEPSSDEAPAVVPRPVQPTLVLRIAQRIEPPLYRPENFTGVLRLRDTGAGAIFVLLSGAAADAAGALDDAISDDRDCSLAHDHVAALCHGNPARRWLIGALRHLAAWTSECCRGDGLALAGIGARPNRVVHALECNRPPAGIAD